ncbi:nucleotidyltransferase domain-containing protein [Fodinicurvata halophila]|uniref:Nucleotidyltransferase domain-containing protein n=1 Tax=Fodinicurvata halophila TaxID=1419723 RepID=A0ABV8ULT6_9PROT
MNKLEALTRKRADARLKTAQACVEQICQEAIEADIQISVIGSLVDGSFYLHSDIDLLVHGNMNPTRRLMIERLVARHIKETGIPYDLFYAADLTPEDFWRLTGNDR